MAGKSSQDTGMGNAGGVRKGVEREVVGRQRRQRAAGLRKALNAEPKRFCLGFALYGRWGFIWANDRS